MDQNIIDFKGGNSNIPDTMANSAPSNSPAQPSESTPPKNRKLFFWIGIALGIVALLGLVFYFLIYRGTVNIILNPNDATIFLNNREFKGGRVRAGNHILKVEKAGFVSLNENFKINIGETKNFTINLRPTPVLTKIYDGQANYLALDQERKSIVFIDTKNGQAYRASLGIGSPIIDQISEQRFTGIDDFNWSPDRLLGFFSKDNQTKQFNFRRIDLVEQQIIPWPEGTKSIDWRPDNTRIAYYFAPLTDDPQKVIININQKQVERTFTPVKGEKSLITADINNLEYSRVFDFKTTQIVDPKITWSPDGQKILIQDSKLHIFETSLRDQIKSLEMQDTVVDARWFPDNQSIIFETLSGAIKIITLEGQIVDAGVQGKLKNIALVDGGFIFATQDGSQAKLTKFNLEDQTKSEFKIDSIPSSLPQNLIFYPQENLLYFISQGQIFSLILDNGRYQL